MPGKFHWDLIRVIVIIGGVSGVVFSIMQFYGVHSPITGLLSTDLSSLIVESVICGAIAVGWGVLGLDIWEDKYPFLVFIGAGLAMIFLFGNIVGMLFIIAAVPIPFGS